MAFANVSSSSSGTQGINLQRVSGSLTTTGGTLTGAAGSTFKVDTSTATVTYAGGITQATAGQRVIDIQNNTGGTITLSGAITSNGGTGTGIILNSNTGATINFTGGIALTTNANDAFTATAGGIVNVSGTNNITTTSGKGINWNTDTSGTGVTFNNVTSSTGAAVTIASSAASNFTFNDVTSTTGTTVSVTTATGAFVFHAITKNGGATGIDVNSATGSFIVNGTGTTAGSGGTIQNTTSHGAKFVSSNNITLKNINLANDAQTQTVAGSSAQCGGNLRTGDNLSCVAGIFMQTVTGVTLTNVSVTGSNQMGISGNNVTTFALSNSTVTGNGNEAFEEGLIFQNLKGTSSITDSIIKNNAARQIHIANTTNSSTLTLGITGTRTNNAYPTMDTSTTMIGNDAPNGSFTQQGILFETNTTGTSINMTLNINGVVFNNNLPQNAVDIQPVAASGTLGGTTKNSSFDTNAGGVIISVQNAEGGNYDVLNNEFNRTNLQSVLYSGANPTSGILTGTIQGNTIGTSGQSGSACVTPGGVAGASNCTGIDVNFIGGSGGIQLKIGGTGAGEGNTVQQFDGVGIRLKGKGCRPGRRSPGEHTEQYCSEPPQLDRPWHRNEHWRFRRRHSCWMLQHNRQHCNRHLRRSVCRMPAKGSYKRKVQLNSPSAGIRRLRH